jgi:hypothetical protein
MRRKSGYSSDRIHGLTYMILVVGAILIHSGYLPYILLAGLVIVIAYILIKNFNRSTGLLSERYSLTGALYCEKCGTFLKNNGLPKCKCIKKDK